MTDNSEHSHLHFWLRELPYAVVWILTVIGVGYTSVSQQTLVAYWEFLAVVIGILCVITGWRYAADRHALTRLIITQVLHWLAILGAMNLLLLPTVQLMSNVDATDLSLLMLLALGTFIAGVHTVDWQISLLGLVMALCVPGIAWIERSALIVLVIIVAVIAIGFALWPRLRGLWRRPAEPLSH